MVEIMIDDYKEIKDRLVVSLCSIDNNLEMLGRIPHTAVGDMAEIYKILLERDENHTTVAKVTHDMLNAWGVDLDQLRHDAYESMEKLNPAKVTSLTEVLGIPPEMSMDGPDLTVVTTQSMNHGASAMFYPGMMEQLAERTGGDFFMLPSSVHEVLILPDNGNMAPDELQEIIESVNYSEVAPEEQLSDKAYHYDSKNHVFEMAEEFEAQKERRMEQPEHELEKKKHKNRGR